MTLSNNPSSSERERENVFLSFIIIPVLETLSSHHFDGISLSLSLPRLLSLSLDLIFGFAHDPALTRQRSILLLLL